MLQIYTDIVKQRMSKYCSGHYSKEFRFAVYMTKKRIAIYWVSDIMSWTVVKKVKPVFQVALEYNDS